MLAVCRTSWAPTSLRSRFLRTPLPCTPLSNRRLSRSSSWADPRHRRLAWCWNERLTPSTRVPVALCLGETCISMWIRSGSVPPCIASSTRAPRPTLPCRMAALRHGARDSGDRQLHGRPDLERSHISAAGWGDVLDQERDPDHWWHCCSGRGGRGPSWGACRLCRHGRGG